MVNWMDEDGLLFVFQNNVFVPHTVANQKELSFVVNATQLQRPVLSATETNATIYAGLNFPAIPLFVTQPHYPLSITPLPAGVKVIPRTDGTTGYWITGVFEEEGTFDIMVTAKNPRGTDSLKLHMVVMRGCWRGD